MGSQITESRTLGFAVTSEAPVARAAGVLRIHAPVRGLAHRDGLNGVVRWLGGVPVPGLEGLRTAQARRHNGSLDLWLSLGGRTRCGSPVQGEGFG